MTSEHKAGTNLDSRKSLEEGKRYIDLYDPIQASEKLYKAAEEVVKALSSVHAPDLRKEALKRGRWTATLLFKVVEKTADKLGEDVIHSWDAAWLLHVEGFHEAKLDIDSVSRRMKEIEDLAKLAEGKSR
jgi:hypothetical protein